VNYKLSSLAWRKPYAEDLLETDSERLLTVLAATEIAVFQQLSELAADKDGAALFCAQVFSSVGKHADRRISSLSKLR
jgi:hypothetical protein